MSTHTFVIAEAGVNHNGSIDRALEMVAAAASAGADAVKFQTFRAEALTTPDAAKAAYQQAATGGDDGQFAMLKALELNEDEHLRLSRACADHGIEFMSTAFDVGSLRFLIDQAGVARIKIPSGEITNPQLLLAAAHCGCPILLSTGMAILEEIETALGVLAFGMMSVATPPGEAAFRQAFREQRSLLKNKVTILQCTTAYPTPAEDINLRAMDTIAATFGLPVGFSDHSLGTAIAVAAVGRGATVLEKHFTLDRSLPGPDHAASLECGELKSMITDIRIVEQALGSGDKVRAASEAVNVMVARRGVYAARDIAAGESVGLEDLVLLRPETAMSPMNLWRFVGQKSQRAYRKMEAFDG